MDLCIFFNLVREVIFKAYYFACYDKCIICKCYDYITVDSNEPWELQLFLSLRRTIE